MLGTVKYAVKGHRQITSLGHVQNVAAVAAPNTRPVVPRHTVIDALTLNAAPARAAQALVLGVVACVAQRLVLPHVELGGREGGCGSDSHRCPALEVTGPAVGAAET